MTVEQTARAVALEMAGVGAAADFLVELQPTSADKVFPPLKAKKKRQRTKGNKNYLIGRGFEYRCKHVLEKAGYIVQRSYASKGAYDLLAIKGLPYPSTRRASRVLLVQCKFGKHGKLKDYEVQELCRLAIVTGGYPIEALCKKKRGPIWWHDLQDERWMPFYL